jgi:hypothetical protein
MGRPHVSNDRLGALYLCELRWSVEPHRKTDRCLMNLPKHASAQQLATVGLTLVRRNPLTVQCHRCGAEWRPEARPRVKYCTPWWECQKGCNHSCAET